MAASLIERIASGVHRRDLLLAAAVAVAAQLETWLGSGQDSRLAYSVAALGMCVPLAWRRRAPIVALALVFAPLMAMAIAGLPIDSAYVMAVLVLAFHGVGAYRERREAVVGLCLGLAGLAALLTVESLIAPAGESAPAAGDFVFIAVIVGAVWALAVALHERSAHAGAMEARAERLERERELRAREAVAAERARMARELHDVVAHSISVIAVQAGSLRRRLRHDRPDAAGELSEVERAAREALAEMRRLLGLLRSHDDDLALTPQPGIDQVERLVEQMRRTGLPVELETRGEPRVLAPGVELAAYRIVQEALTNALKHAHPSQVTVCLRYGPRELELEVLDDGRGANGSRGGDGGGHGLVGMRERVALYGGALDAGPREEGGFAIRARLPVSGP